MGAAGAANLWGSAMSILGQQKAQKAFNRGNTSAQSSLGTPPIFWKGGPWWEALTGPNNLLAQNAVSLLKGNGMSELEPALRASDQAGQRNQMGLKQSLARSGLIGSGVDIGNSFAAQNSRDVNKANLLAQLPQIRRENLASLFPYFSRYLGNQEFRAGGISNLRNERGKMNASSVANQWATGANAISGMGGSGKAGQGAGATWQGPGGQSAPASSGKGGMGGGGSK